VIKARQFLPQNRLVGQAGFGTAAAQLVGKKSLIALRQAQDERLSI
jgi:hypothetical protein